MWWQLPLCLFPLRPGDEWRLPHRLFSLRPGDGQVAIQM